MSFVSNVIVTDGDSITAGQGVNAGYPYLIHPAYYSSIHDISVPGQLLSTMVTNGAANVDTLKGTSTHDTVIVWGGTNDLFNGSTPAQVYAILQTYCANRKSAGWQVIVVTPLSRNTDDSEMQAYANLIRAGIGVTLQADAIADVAANPLLGALGAYANTTYFLDGIHPTQLSDNTLIAPVILQSLNNLNPGGPRTAPLYTDDFTAYTPGTDLHTSNPNWVENITPWQAKSGGVSSSSGANLASSYQGVAPNNNQRVAVRLGELVQNTGPGIRVAASGNTGYFMRTTGTGTSYFKAVSGVFTGLGVSDTTTKWAIGDEMALSISGTTITGYQNGNILQSFTDNSLASGFGGLTGNAGTADTKPGVETFLVENFPATLVTPTFSPLGGSYGSAQSVSISSGASDSPGFAMYYTTDGSTPTTGSTLYIGPITVSSSSTIKVLSVATGFLNSGIGSATYTIASVLVSPGSGLVPVQIFGRLPNGTIAAVAVDTHGNLAVSGGSGGALNSVDVLKNGVATPVQVFGTMPNGKRVAVAVDANGNLCATVGSGGGNPKTTVDIAAYTIPTPVIITGREPASGKLYVVPLNASNALYDSKNPGATASLSVPGVIPVPVILCGRAPNGKLVAVTLDSSGRLCISGIGSSGSTNVVDVYKNGVPTGVQIFGINTSGKLSAVPLDVNANLMLS